METEKCQRTFYTVTCLRCHVDKLHHFRLVPSVRCYVQSMGSEIYTSLSALKLYEAERAAQSSVDFIKDLIYAQELEHYYKDVKVEKVYVGEPSYVGEED